MEKTDTYDPKIKSWNLKLRTTNLMSTHCYSKPKENSVRIVRGRNIYSFTDSYTECDLWCDPSYALRVEGTNLSSSRLAIRSITHPKSPRSLVATIIPRGVVSSESILTSYEPTDITELLVICALLNSTVADWEFRLSVLMSANIYQIEQLHIPVIESGDPVYSTLAKMSASLIAYNLPGIKNELRFDHKIRRKIEYGRTATRIDALAAIMYGLDYGQYCYILNKFDGVDPGYLYACSEQYIKVTQELRDYNMMGTSYVSKINLT